MNRQYRALLRREYLEYQKLFLLSPILVLALVVVVGLTFTGGTGALDLEISDGQSTNRVEIDSDGSGGGLGRTLAVLLFDVAGASDVDLNLRMRALMNLIAVPFYWVLLAVSLFALIACLHEERKEGSVLFWKSMPVADWLSVTSKYVFVAWVAPMITIAVIWVAQIYATVLLSTWVEDGAGSRVWLHSGLLMSLAQLLLGYLLNGLVVLPLFAWVMMVSSWAKRAPMLWALGLPVWLSVLDGILLESRLVGPFIAFHGSMPTLPRTHALDGSGGLSMTTTSLSDQIGILMQGQFWVGLMVGAGLLAITIYLRRTKNEL